MRVCRRRKKWDLSITENNVWTFFRRLHPVHKCIQIKRYFTPSISYRVTCSIETMYRLWRLNMMPYLGLIVLCGRCGLRYNLSFQSFLFKSQTTKTTRLCVGCLGDKIGLNHFYIWYDIILYLISFGSVSWCLGDKIGLNKFYRWYDIIYLMSFGAVSWCLGDKMYSFLSV